MKQNLRKLLQNTGNQFLLYVHTILFFFLCLNPAFAQLSFKAELIDSKHGFYAGDVISIKEDKVGNVYLGTDVGLYQYDGNVFNYLQAQTDNNDDSPFFGIEDIIFYPAFNKLFFTSIQGVHFYDFEKKEIQDVISQPDLNSNLEIIKFASSVNDSTLYILYHTPIHNSFRLFKMWFERSGFQWVEIPLKMEGEELNLKNFRRHYFAANKFQPEKILFMSDRHIYQIDINTHIIDLLYEINVTKETFEGANQIVHLVSQIDGTILLSIEKFGLCVYHPDKNSLVPIEINFEPNETIFSICISNDGKYWLGSNSGNLYKYDLLKRDLKKIHLHKIDITGNLIKTIYESKDRNLYIMSTSGLYKVNLSANIFRQFNWASVSKSPSNILIKNGILHPRLPVYVFDTYQSDSIFAADLSTGSVRYIGRYKPEKRDLILYASYQNKSILANVGLQTYMIDSVGSIQEFRPVPTIEKKLNENTSSIEQFKVYQNKTIFWAGKNWVCLQNEHNEGYCFTFSPIQKKIEQLMLHDGSIFMATKDSIFRYSGGKQKWLPIHWNQPFSGSANLAHIALIGNKWIIATHTNGIYKGEMREDQLLSVKVCQNCSNQIGQKIAFGQMNPDGNIYYSTNSGILYYNPIDDSYMEYYYNFNLSEKRQYRPFYCNQTGLCAISTISNLEWTYYDALFPTEDKSRLMLSKLVLNDSLKIDFLKNSESILQLNHKENNLRFEWTHYHALHSDYYAYSYKLEGWDEEWQFSSDKFYITYQNLPAGKYTFHIRAHQNLSPDKIQSASFSFEISPPYWQSWWFQLLLSIIVTSLIYIYIRQKVSSIQKEAAIKSQYEKQLNELKLNSLRMQMNPHFMFNSLNSIKSYILKNEKEIAARYLSNFAFLIRSVLNFSEEKFVSLKSEVAVLRTYIELEQLRFSRGFDYTIHMNDDIASEELLVQPLLLQPFVENAIWHGLMQKEGDRLLEIEIFVENDMLVYQVTDNGIGRKKSEILKSKTAGRKSYGIQITKARMESLHESALIEITDLKNEKDEARGTRVTLKAPLMMDQG